MKTKELIAALQEADPDGGAEVVIGSTPIYFVEKLPGYYDGAYQQLIQDHSKDPYYNIIGVRVTRKGWKVRLNTVGWEDFLYDNPEGDVVVEEGVFGREQILKRIEEVRVESMAMDQESNRRCVGWVLDKFQEGYRIGRMHGAEKFMWVYFKEGETCDDVTLKISSRESYDRQLNNGSVAAINRNTDLFKIIQHENFDEVVRTEKEPDWKA